MRRKERLKTLAEMLKTVECMAELWKQPLPTEPEPTKRGKKTKIIKKKTRKKARG